MNAHIPVMLNEVLQTLSPQDGDIIVDGTFGAGGYSRAILESADCTVYAIDRDPDAISRASDLKQQYEQRFHISFGCFGDMQSLLHAVNVSRVNGIVLDIGLSSPQINDARRGFSFKQDGPLDMRMSKNGISAYDIVNTYEHGSLAHIIKHYGEEKMAGKVASAIVRYRSTAPIATTRQLADIVRSVVHNKNSKIDPATRTFQGLRIAVNDELSELQKALDASISLLHDGGRLTVVSFHSLEDRMVKQFIRNNVGGVSGNRHMPIATPKPAVFQVKNHKPILCTDNEAIHNTRARSAKLRTARRMYA